MDLNEFNKLSKKLADLNRELHQEEGKQQTLKDRLQAEFDLTSIAEALALLDEMEVKSKHLYSKSKRLRKEFDEAWGTLLADTSGSSGI